ncbi:MAG TPA: hypothetical protein VFN65_13670 [Solirubrobacteraceae bacterium]|nr:hypothetical protein [Solirubrobacteraceae bacterium]
MSYTDTISQISTVEAQIGQIQQQLASLQTAFSPAAASSAGTLATTSGGAGLVGGSTSFASSVAPTTTSGSGSSFTSLLSSAVGTPATGGGAGLPPATGTMLTSGQRQFASRLAADTGLDSGVVSAWLLAEESGGAAVARQSANNNDWLNIGYTDSGTYGSADAVWSSPTTAADATAGWLKGQNTIPGYGTASSGIQAILQTAGQAPAAQISALQSSGWASSGYPDLTSLYAQVSGR